MTPPPPVTLEQLGDIVTHDEVAALFRTTRRAIERLVRRGRFHEIPPPALTRPMRWSKADLARHLRGEVIQKLRRPA